MSNANHTLTDEQFATVCANLLHQCLIAPSRTVVKRVFRDLQAGIKVSLTKLRMEDDSLLRVDLTLDSTAFIGILNFSTFRGVVQELLIQFREHLTSEKPLTTFRALDEAGNATTERRLYGVFAQSVQGGSLNILMLGVDPHLSEPQVLLELMFVDPSQMTQSESASRLPIMGKSMGEG